MADPAPGNDYHSLLSLHHGLRLSRHLRGDPGADPASSRGTHDPVALAPTVEHWPQRQRDQELLRESLAVLMSLEGALLHLYTALFRDRPYLRGLFPGSIMAQRERLSRYLLQLIDGLDSPESLVSLVQVLGRDHRKLGVRAPHYRPFADALIESLRVAAGERWRPEYEDAWLRLYWFTARIMIEFSERVTSEPPYFTAVVTEHQRRGPDIAVFRVRTTEPYPYEAGQHAALQSRLMPNAWRFYSIANAPTDDGTLEFHVRATRVGGLSDVLVERTVVGDVLRVGPPRGSLLQPKAWGENLLLVAGGTGLAPLKAILGELARASMRPRTSLFFGARNRDELYDLDALLAYGERAPWLRIVLASETPAYPYEYGRIADVVAKHGPWHGCRAVIAGPHAMVTALRHSLPELGVALEHIAHDPI